MKKLTMDSTIGEIYHTAIGHDILYKILMQANIPEFSISNPLTSKLKLKAVVPLTKKMLDDEFWDAFLHLINS